jgi:hypothetical protein
MSGTNYLREHYKSLPTLTERLNFRDKIITYFKLPQSTFYNWLNHTDVPDRLKYEYATKFLGKNYEEVFPKEKAA